MQGSRETYPRGWLSSQCHALIGWRVFKACLCRRCPMCLRRESRYRICPVGAGGGSPPAGFDRHPILPAASQCYRPRDCQRPGEMRPLGPVINMPRFHRVLDDRVGGIDVNKRTVIPLPDLRTPPASGQCHRRVLTVVRIHLRIVSYCGAGELGRTSWRIQIEDLTACQCGIQAAVVRWWSIPTPDWVTE